MNGYKYMMGDLECSKCKHFLSPSRISVSTCPIYSADPIKRAKQGYCIKLGMSQYSDFGCAHFLSASKDEVEEVPKKKRKILLLEEP